MKHFIIALKQNDLSMRIANECVVQAKQFGLDVEIFDGVYGYNAKKVFYSHEVKDSGITWKKNQAGVIGCAASHFLLWKKCVELNQPIIILEQDGYMVRPLPKDIEHQFEDICKLDPHNPFLPSYTNLVNKADITSVVKYDLSWGYKKKTAPFGGYFLGAWAYIIKPHAALKLIESFKTYGWVPADKQLGEKILNLQTTSNTIFRIHPYYTNENIEQISLTRNLQ